MRTDKKKIGTKPFSGQRFVEEGRVKILWYVDGRPQERTIGKATEERKRYADKVLEKALLRARAEAEGIVPPESGRPTLLLRDLLDRHLEDARRRRSHRTGQPLRPDTLRLFDQHDQVLRRELADELGKPAADLTRPVVREVILRLLGRGLADKTVATIVDYLGQVYRWGHQEVELLAANPIAGIRVPSRKGKGKPYTLDELRRLLGVALDRERDTSDWRIRTLVVLETHYGSRGRQMTNLRWSDIDFDRLVSVRLRDGRVLRFRGAITLRQEVVGSKGRADRELPMVAAVRAVLMEAWNRRHADDGYVLWNWRDASRPAVYQAMLVSLQRLEKLAGVEHLKGRGFHAFRRGHATTVAAGVGAKAAADAIGDTIEVAMKSYIKVSQEDLAEGVAYMADTLASDGEPGLNRDSENLTEKGRGEAAAG